MNPTAQKLVITSPQKTLPKPPKSIIKEIIPNSLESEYAGYLKLKKSLSALIDEENIAGTKTIIRPKTLPQTGKSILSRVKKLVNGREIDVNKYPKTGVVTYPGPNTAGFGGVGNTVIFGYSSYGSQILEGIRYIFRRSSNLK